MAIFKSTNVSSSEATTSAVGTTGQRPGITYTTQSFTANGASTFSVPTGINVVDVLIVGGGGGGAGPLGGGGGAGGFVEARSYQ